MSNVIEFPAEDTTVYQYYIYTPTNMIPFIGTKAQAVHAAERIHILCNNCEITVSGPYHV